MAPIIKQYQVLIIVINYILAHKHKKKIKIKLTINAIEIITATNLLCFIIGRKKHSLLKKIKSVRKYKTYSHIVMIADNFSYSDVFSEHLELLGLIDFSTSSSMITDKVIEYLDYFFTFK